MTLRDEVRRGVDLWTHFERERALTDDQIDGAIIAATLRVPSALRILRTRISPTTAAGIVGVEDIYNACGKELDQSEIAATLAGIVTDASASLLDHQRATPKTIRDLVRDLTSEEDVDDAIYAAIPEGITLLSPGFELSRETMLEAWRRLSSNDADIVTDVEFEAWGFQSGGGNPAGDAFWLHRGVARVIEDAVVALVTRR